MNDEIAEGTQIGSIPMPDEESLLTPADVAKLLRVPVSWVYGCCRSRAKYPMSYIKVGHYLRFQEQDVRDFIAAQKKIPRVLERTRMMTPAEQRGPVGKKG